MKIKIGDKVKFLNETGGGIVTSIVNKKMVNVADADGFEVPALISHLVVVEEGNVYDLHEELEVDLKEEEIEFPEREIEIVEEGPKGPVYVEGNDEPNSLLALVPENGLNPVEGEIKAYLVNDSNCYLLYHYAHLKNEKYATVQAGKLAPNTKMLLESFNQFDLSDFPELVFQLIPFKEEANQLVIPYRKDISINPVKFYKTSSYRTNDYFHEASMIFSLTENPLNSAVDNLSEKDFKELVQEKERAARPKSSKEKKMPQNLELIEVDLHIHELISDSKGLSNKEILEIQVEKFRSELEAAKKSGACKIVFIHGVGNGRLRSEIRRILDREYKYLYYQDASFREYGYGATMVTLKKKRK